MMVKHWNLRITGSPGLYQIHLEADGDAQSADEIVQSLQSLLGHIRLESGEIDADLQAGRVYEAYSLPTIPTP
jgi:hypothetical protein